MSGIENAKQNSQTNDENRKQEIRLQSGKCYKE